MLTIEQQREFDGAGLLHRPGAIRDERRAGDVRQRLERALAAERQIHRNAPETWIASG
jgi:hypothetical protein